MVLDSGSGIGFELFDDDSIAVDSSLMTGLVGALIMFTDNLDRDYEFEKAEIGALRILVIGHKGLSYVAFTDKFDNIAHTKKTMEKVILFIGDRLDDTVIFSYVPSPSIIDQIKLILSNSTEFLQITNSVLSSVHVLDNFEEIEFNNLSLIHLERGLIHQFFGEEDSMELLMNLCSQLPFEKDWVGESNVFFQGNHSFKESLVLSRIYDTNYILAGKIIYATENKNQMLMLFYKIKTKIEHEYLTEK